MFGILSCSQWPFVHLLWRNFYSDSLSILFFFQLIFIRVYLLYNVVLVSSVEQSESAMCIHVTLFWISFSFRLPQSIEQSSLCYTIGPLLIFILSYLPFHSLAEVLFICSGQYLTRYITCRHFLPFYGVSFYFLDVVF